MSWLQMDAKNMPADPILSSKSQSANFCFSFGAKHAASQRLQLVLVALQQPASAAGWWHNFLVNNHPATSAK